MKKRNTSLDLLKILLAIFVVLLHCNFLFDYNQKISYFIVEGLCRVAVPTFFVINGYFFRYAKNKKKWAKRVFILYSVWMFIYLLLWFKPDVKSVISTFFIGYHHLWYIKAMLLCGVFMICIDKIKSKFKLVLAILLFLIGVLIQYLLNFNILKFDEFNSAMDTTFIHRNFLFRNAIFHNWAFTQ